MRVALVSDMHGNMLALEAVLADLEQQAVDRVVCLGDVAATGPKPAEVLARLRELDWPVVQGNTDARLIDADARVTLADDAEFARKIEEIDVWCRDQLAPEDIAFARGFQPTIDVPLEGDATLLCFHGSPRSFNDIIWAVTPDAELDEFFAGHSATLLAGGHTHTRLLRRYGAATILNPGSIGMPTDKPWAEYAIVESRGQSLSTEFRRVPFDMRQFVAQIRASGMPHAEWLAAEWE